MTTSNGRRFRRALTPPPRQARVKRARKRHCARSARSSNTRTKVPARCSLYHFISNSKRNYMHAMSQLCRQLRHEVTKKAIKAALKLCACMQYFTYASYLRTCLWNGFQNFAEAPQHCLPHLTHPIQLVSSLEETKTWSGSESSSSF